MFRTNLEDGREAPSKASSLHFSNQNQIYRTLQLFYRVIPSFILYISVTKIRYIELYNCYTGREDYTERKTVQNRQLYRIADCTE